jgi:hypothetical protein
MIILDDEQFLEGVAGGIGWIIAVFYIRKNYLNKKNANIAVVGAITWSILWIIRKITMNMYKNYKKIYKIKNKTISLPLKKIHHLPILLFICFSLLFIFVFRHSKKSNSILTRLPINEIPLIMFMSTIGLILYKQIL